MADSQRERDDPVVKAQVEKLEAEAERARAEAEQAKAEAEKAGAEADKAKAEAARLKTYANDVEANAEKRKAEIAKLNADTKRAKAIVEGIEHQKAFINKHNEDVKKQVPRQLGIRAFVRESLLDIMAGVDDAAAKGKLSELRDGLEDFLPSVTAIGAPTSAEGQVERVEFDLVVAVGAAEEQEKDQVLVGGAKVNLPVLQNFGLSAGISGGMEKVERSSTSNEQTSRICFAVPITYAVQNNPPDE